MLSSCALLPFLSGIAENDDSKPQSDVVMQHIADAVKEHDAAALKNLFSPRARENANDLDSGLAYFLSFFPSGKMTWKLESFASGGDNDYPTETLELFANYKVFAAGKKYDLYFADFTADTAHANHLGIYALGVTPYNAQPATAPTAASKAFDLWASQFHSATTGSGTPGVYVPEK